MKIVNRYNGVIPFKYEYIILCKHKLKSAYCNPWIYINLQSMHIYNDSIVWYKFTYLVIKTVTMKAR